MSSKNPIRPSEITPEHIYNDRRKFLKSIGIGLGATALSSLAFGKVQSLIILLAVIYQLVMKKLPLRTSRPTTTTMSLALKNRIPVNMQISSLPILGQSVLRVQ